MSRHFIWLGPLSNLVFFLVIGLLLAVGRQARPACDRLVRPPVDLRLHHTAGAHGGRASDLLLGLVTRRDWDRGKPGPGIQRHASALRDWLLWSFPFMMGSVLALAGFVFVGDWLELVRESGRPLPPANSPNVLLIVLDTVRADRLSLYGYERSTTPNLDRLSKRGIRFDLARATAPWTLRFAREHVHRPFATRTR